MKNVKVETLLKVYLSIDEVSQILSGFSEKKSIVLNGQKIDLSIGLHQYELIKEECEDEDDE